MSDHRHEDVVVLGAGPAGCTAARLLSSWGRRVVIVTRAPSRRSLAESLPPSASKLLARAGVRSAVEAAGFLRANGNTVRWGDGDVRMERFQDGLGYQLPRDRFDALLLSEAADAGASIVWGVTGGILPEREGDGCVAVRFNFGGFAASTRAPWVLDCTGQKQAARGVIRGEAPRTLALAAVWEADHWELPDVTHTLVESCDGGWAWSVPVSVERRFVTVMLDPEVTEIKGRREVEAEYLRQLARAEWIRSTMPEGARMIGSPWARDATPRYSGGTQSDGVLRVGDAASTVDPLSSFGIKKALASAWLAAVVVNTCLDDPSLAPHATALYERRERAMYRALGEQSARMAGAAGATHGSPFWQARADDVDPFGGAGAETGEAAEQAVRADARVAAAFAELKSRESFCFRRSSTITCLPRPTVEGERIVLREHLVGGAFPSALRYMRNVDLPLLLTLAPEHDDVGALYSAYAQACAPVPLPDFLAALATLVANEALTFA